MINPQSLTLIQAYDPYLTEERVAFFQEGRPTPLTENPSADDPCWTLAFMIDIENVLCCVLIKGFTSLDAARAHVLAFLEGHKKMFRVGGVTDVITETHYGYVVGWCPDNAFDWLEPL